MAQVQTDTSSFPLSLRPWPTQGTEDDLETTISRIFESRGHFKNITEQSLTEEIKQQHASGEDAYSDAGEADEDAEELDPKARREKVLAAKAEMWQSLEYVHLSVIPT